MMEDSPKYQKMVGIVKEMLDMHLKRVMMVLPLGWCDTRKHSTTGIAMLYWDAILDVATERRTAAAQALLEEKE